MDDKRDADGAEARGWLADEQVRLSAEHRVMVPRTTMLVWRARPPTTASACAAPRWRRSWPWAARESNGWTAPAPRCPRTEGGALVLADSADSEDDRARGEEEADEHRPRGVRVRIEPFRLLPDRGDVQRVLVLDPVAARR